MQTIPIASTQHWHTVRGSHVGGSEVAALFGLSPYVTPFELWHIKSRHIAPPDLNDEERVAAGNYMEPAIAAWAADKWGIQIAKFKDYAVHPTIAGMGCTPDYMTSDCRLSVQIKNVDGLEFFKNPEWEADGEELTKAPMHILLQVQHEMAVTGAEEAWLVVCVGGNRLMRMVIAPRPKTIQKLERAVTDFWLSIQDGTEPKPNFQADSDTISALHAEALPETTVDLSANNRAHEVVAEWMRGDSLEKQGKTLKEASKAELLVMMGNNASATVGDFKIKSRAVKASAGKVVTEAMVGMMVGARAAYRRFSISTPAQEGTAS